MIKVYHAPATRSARVLWVLEELGVPYETVSLTYPPRVHHPEYEDVNPIKTIPTMVDGQVRLTESLAICEYLARAYGPKGLIPEAADPLFPQYLQFFHYGEATLAPPLGVIVRYSFREPPERRLPQAVDDARETFVERLEPVRRAIANRPFLAGETLTLADVSVGYALALAERLRIGDQFGPEVQSYLDRLKALPARQRAYERT
ncbi:glutathione S-transferase family protein [Phenylobacterium terrae]|uniref:Glutathione S-transferase family protein n=1 Tax=Phenylobacterium terrae TaxID=2665495 RepID=A0ABW4MZZ2_9CAUL